MVRNLPPDALMTEIIMAASWVQGSFNKLTTVSRQASALSSQQSVGDKTDIFVEPLLTTEVERFLQVTRMHLVILITVTNYMLFCWRLL